VHDQASNKGTHAQNPSFGFFPPATHLDDNVFAGHRSLTAKQYA
jgi:hypothetical protein